MHLPNKQWKMECPELSIVHSLNIFSEIPIFLTKYTRKSRKRGLHVKSILQSLLLLRIKEVNFLQNPNFTDMLLYTTGTRTKRSMTKKSQVSRINFEREEDYSLHSS